VGSVTKASLAQNVHRVPPTVVRRRISAYLNLRVHIMSGSPRRSPVFGRLERVSSKENRRTTNRESETGTIVRRLPSRTRIAVDYTPTDLCPEPATFFFRPTFPFHEDLRFTAKFDNSRDRVLPVRRFHLISCFVTIIFRLRTDEV